MIERTMKISLYLFGVLVLLVILKLPLQPTEQVLSSWTLPLSGQTIVIDPGHGGPDGGAKARDETSEKTLALIVSKMLRDYLQQAGAIVYLTRETDKDLASSNTRGLSNRKAEDLRNRMKFIEDHDPDFFLSIHLNSIPSPRWSGAQTFYYPKYDESRHLAKMIQSEITRNLENTDRKALAINNVYLLKYASVPSTLVEIGFLSNPRELQQLKEEKYQRLMASSIYQGILRYVTEDLLEEED